MWRLISSTSKHFVLDVRNFLFTVLRSCLSWSFAFSFGRKVMQKISDELNVAIEADLVLSHLLICSIWLSHQEKKIGVLSNRRCGHWWQRERERDEENSDNWNIGQRKASNWFKFVDSLMVFLELGLGGWRENVGSGSSLPPVFNQTQWQLFDFLIPFRKLRYIFSSLDMTQSMTYNQKLICGNELWMENKTWFRLRIHHIFYAFHWIQAGNLQLTSTV